MLRWVMAMVFAAFGIRKFTLQSANSIVHYISNGPFIWWLSVVGVRREAYVLGSVELTVAVLLVVGAFNPILSAISR